MNGDKDIETVLTTLVVFDSYVFSNILPFSSSLLTCSSLHILIFSGSGLSSCLGIGDTKNNYKKKYLKIILREYSTNSK